MKFSRKRILVLPGLFLAGYTNLFAYDGTVIDTGATAWMLTSTALVLLMVPGLAMFYGGLVRAKNVLGTMMHSFVAISLIGVLWALLLTGTTLSIVSGIGVLVLVGIVVNNGIVLVDYINQLRRDEGYALTDAVREAGRVRLRPILMTAFTTIFGLLPLALQIGEGSEFWSPLGRSVIGGMVVSTFLNVVFIPVLYVVIETVRERVGGRRSEAAQPA